MLTAAQSVAQQRRAAGALAAAGLGPGDRVAFLLEGSEQLVSAVLGALRSGVVPVLLDRASAPPERAHLLEDADPALVVDDPAGLAALLDGAEAELAPVPLARPMHYTSGTTGRRKGVWSGLLPLDAAQALVDEERELWGLHPGDVHLVVGALHHSAPLRFAAGTLLAGGAVEVLPRFTAEAALAALERVRPTTAFCAPAHLQRVLELVDAGAPLPPLDRFRLLAHAGAPCPPALKARLLALWPPGSVWEFYGATEGQFTVCGPELAVARPGTVGRARPGRRLSTDPDGTVWCEVPPHARFSYWRDAAKTAAAWRGDAFTVGDVGRLDDDGVLELEGRREDLVISGGVNVYPLEVELVLGACPGVQDVAVFGRPDERWGQRLCAAYVGSAAPEELAAWAAARLGPAKRPKEHHRVEQLPRTVTGKVRRLTLDAELGLEPGSWPAGGTGTRPGSLPAGGTGTRPGSLPAGGTGTRPGS